MVGEDTIAMNRIELIYPKTKWRPTYYIFCSSNCADNRWGKKWSKSIIKASKEESTQPLIWSRYKSNIENNGGEKLDDSTIYLDTFSENKIGQDNCFSTDASDRLDKSGTSMNVALQLAYYMEYDEAKYMLSTLKIKNSLEYKELVKNGKLEKLPTRPERYYKKRGWMSWADFLSNNNIIACQDRVDYYYCFVDATKVVQKLRFKNITDYHKRARCIDNRLPRNPDTFYSEWDGWSKYLGIDIISDNQKHANYLSYDEAKVYMKNNYPNIKSGSQWKKFRDNNDIPLFLPLNPWHTYKNKGWLGWGDYLGTGNVSNKDKVYLPYEEAEKIIHTYSLNNNREWREFIKNNKNLGIPSSPDKTYKDKGWVNWYVWLGK